MEGRIEGRQEMELDTLVEGKQEYRPMYAYSSQAGVWFTLSHTHYGAPEGDRSALNYS